MTEGKATEVKREYVEDIKYTAVAFANTDGAFCGAQRQLVRWPAAAKRR